MNFFEQLNQKREKRILENIKRYGKVDERAILKAFEKASDKRNFIIQCSFAMNRKLPMALEEAIIDFSQKNREFLLRDCSSIYTTLSHGSREKMNEIFMTLKNIEMMSKPEIFKWIDTEQQLDILRNVDRNLITPQILAQINENDRLEFIYNQSIENISKEWLETIPEVQRNQLSKKWIKNGNVSVEQLDELIGQESVKNIVKEMIEEGTQNPETGVLSSEFIKQYILQKLCAGTKEMISLPEGMTIGVEIEAEGREIRGKLFDKWEAKTDGTLNNGTEVVSPILSSQDNDTRNIYIMCTILREMGLESSEQCGGHIHIGADHLTSKESYTNLIELWGNLEEVLYIISNAEGEIIRREGASTYATPLSRKIEEALQTGTINLEGENDLETFIEQMKSVQGNRYSGLNLLNIGTEKNTIEFRLANGTINPDTWIQNINLFGGIVHTAERIAQLQRISEEKRTPEQQLEIELFERINNPETPEEEKLDSILTLAVAPDKKQIYEKRYAVNKKILLEHPEVEESLKGNITSKPIKIKQIGKKAFARY